MTTSFRRDLKRWVLSQRDLSKQFAIIIGLPNIGELIGIIHDLGKYSADFQEYLESIIRSWTDPTVLTKWKKGDIDHSTAGAQYIWKNYDRNNKIYIFLAQIISLCVASHHAGLIDCITPEGDDNFSRRMNKADEKTHLNEVVENCDSHILNFGSVIRYLAGFDSIAQAAGRCNRHGLREIGRVIIVNPSEEKLGPLVDIEIGKIIGERVLSEFHMNEEAFNNDLLHPGVMELFFKYYFFARKDEMEYPVKNTKIDRIENLLRLLSLNDLPRPKISRL
jgi:CRISPR-associated endonuclease Cas3-HD